MQRPSFFSRAGFHRMLEGTPQHPARRVVRLSLAALILLNVVAVMLESVPGIGAAHATAFWTFELVSVVVFSIEYVLRVWVCVEDPRFVGRWGRLRFALTPMALIDLVAVLPFWLGGLLMLDMRMLRTLRLLRVFKLSRHSTSMDLLLTVIRTEAASMLSAMFIMMIVIILAASGIYMIEHEVNPAFDSIPAAMWWASVTLTTVGYGDVVPQTVLGKAFGLVITITGVGMVALPAGILASGFSLELQRRREEFRVQVKRAISDGNVTVRERKQLEEQRDELGISADEARTVMRAEQVERTHGGHECPSCGHAF